MRLQKKVGEESLKAAEKSLEIAREALKNEKTKKVVASGIAAVLGLIGGSLLKGLSNK